MPEYYPIFISLAGKQCLIAGLGAVGARKLAGLLNGGCPRVDVFEIRLACDCMPETQNLLKDKRVFFHNHPCARNDIKNSFLVFAATNDRGENARIIKIAHEENVFCNSATDPASSSFISPAVARSGDIVAAISTNGQSPYLAGKLRRELETWLEPSARRAWLLGKLRPLVLEANAAGIHNAEVFKKIAASPILKLLENNKIAECIAILREHAPFLRAEDLTRIFEEYQNDFR